MNNTQDRSDHLLRLAARTLTGHQRRRFQAEVCRSLCDNNPRLAEYRFGWGRQNVATGLHELDTGIHGVPNLARRGARRSEDLQPQLAADIRALVEPRTHADPELRSSRHYGNLSAKEVLEALQTRRGYHADALPKERTMRDILNRLGDRLKRIRKGRPLKKTPDTEAVFANLEKVRQEAGDDPETLEIPVDTKAKVAVGDYVRGEKSRTDAAGKANQGWDRDPPAKHKLVPFGVLVLLTGAPTLVFGSAETSDFWADALQVWWRRVRSEFRGIRRLVVYLDNGPHDSGRRRQFLKRMVQFADWSGLVYYPPYHSKYNPVERCWSSLEKKWNGALLNCWEVIRSFALRMRWLGLTPVVERLWTTYAAKVKVPVAEWQSYEARLQRSESLPKYDITIEPKRARGR